MDSEQEGVTAEEYLKGQRQLELEAREIMPYEPDTCTYPNCLRQLVFACLTCRKQGSSVGVCYSCSIQCHSTHELVELFSKRGFVCDCGTERMEGSACSIRAGGSQYQARESSDRGKTIQPPGHIAGVKLRTGFDSQESRPWAKQSLGLAADIPASENTYNQNFQGRFCDCRILYDPENETQTMHQCFFGEVCGEDWYHEGCIVQTKKGEQRKGNEPELGDNAGKLFEEESVQAKESANESANESILPREELSPVKEELVSKDSTADSMKNEAGFESEAANCSKVQALLSEGFSEFVCWKCVKKFPDAFQELRGYPDISACLNREETKSVEEIPRSGSEQCTSTEPPRKKAKKDKLYSVFLHRQFRSRLAALSESLSEESALKSLLRNYPFFHNEDPVYEPPEDDMASNASEGSLYDLGSSALSTLPVPQALEGLQAYDVMKEKLRGFFKSFVDQKKMVTEKEVRDFFGKMEEERQK